MSSGKSVRFTSDPSRSRLPRHEHDSGIGSSSSEHTASVSSGKPDRGITDQDREDQRQNIFALQEALDEVKQQLSAYKRKCRDKEDALTAANKLLREKEAALRGHIEENEILKQNIERLSSEKLDINERLIAYESGHELNSGKGSEPSASSTSIEKTITDRASESSEASGTKPASSSSSSSSSSKPKTSKRTAKESKEQQDRLRERIKPRDDEHERMRERIKPREEEPPAPVTTSKKSIAPHRSNDTHRPPKTRRPSVSVPMTRSQEPYIEDMGPATPRTSRNNYTTTPLPLSPPPSNRIDRVDRVAASPRTSTYRPTEVQPYGGNTPHDGDYLSYPVSGETTERPRGRRH